MKSTGKAAFPIQRLELALFLILFFVRQALMSHLPIYPIGIAGACDDYLMIELAESLRSFQWLGEYNWLTHVKGAGFPLFLVISNALGVDYCSAINILSACASLLFVQALRPVLKKQWQRMILLAVLMLNPLTFSLEAFQRVYRNGLSMHLTLMVFAGFYGAYLRTNEKGNWRWGALAGVALAWFWHTREDSIWILPFVAVATGLLLFEGMRNASCLKKKLLKSAAAFLPAAMLFISILGVSMLNLHYYGQFLTTDVTGSTSFGKAMKSIYSVSPAEKISNDRLAVTQETLARIGQESATVQSLSEYLAASCTEWDYYDTTPGDGEVESGWFFWCLRAAVRDAGGYETPEKADQIYSAIHNEIELALNEGKLERRATMPSALMAPMPEDGVLKLLPLIGKCLYTTAAFEGVHTSDGLKSDSPALAREFEMITLNFSHTNELVYGETIPFAPSCIRICNQIARIYQQAGPVLAALALLCYVMISAALIMKKGSFSFRIWLMLTGILASLIVLCAGVAYNELVSCISIHYLYLANGFPLVIAFVWLSILHTGSVLTAGKRNENRPKP